ncbi:MAG: hypothetical protein KY469_10810 [Actinobacteria bacterium]|nr:hypothetical protein [Actinomycetota bacterium]
MSSLDVLTREGALVTSRAEVGPPGGPYVGVAVVDGQVIYDVSRRVIRTCQVTLQTDSAGLLAPTGTLLRLYRGAVDPRTGTEFEEPVGVYAFEEDNVTRRSGVVEIAGFDFTQLVSDARWEEPYEVAAGQPIDEALAAALLTRIPWLTAADLIFTPTSQTTTAVVWGEERENDPWDDLDKMAKSAGMWLYWDRAGRARLDPVPDPDTDPVVWTYQPGEATYVDANRRRFGRVHNVVVATGEPADDSPPVRATAEDDDPNSASYVGKYRRPYFLTSPFMTTDAHVQGAADAQLRRLIGLADEVAMIAIPDPRRDVAQVVAVADPDLGGVDGRFVLDAVALPLRPGEMALVTRRRRL